MVRYRQNEATNPGGQIIRRLPEEVHTNLRKASYQFAGGVSYQFTGGGSYRFAEMVYEQPPVVPIRGTVRAH